MLNVECFRPSGRRAIIAALLVLFCFTLPCPAQTNAPRDRSSRYLFIVDNSAAMARCGPAVQKAVGNLLRSSMNAQLRPGDTVGVWTYDDELHAGLFPLQRWTPDVTEMVASNVVAFIKTQKLQGKSRFEAIAPALERIVQDSERLTVLLVTDGDDAISGTPFDNEIKESVTQHFKAQQKARMPFVIVLRAWHGKIIHATVNLAPWPVELPAFPPEPKIVETPKPKPPTPKPVEPKPTPRPVVPSLIVIGDKTISPPPVAAPASGNTNLAATTLTATNAPLQTDGPAPTIPPSPPLASTLEPAKPSEVKPPPAPTTPATPSEPAARATAPATKQLISPAPPRVKPETRPPVEAAAPPAVAVETKPAPTRPTAQVAEPAQSAPTRAPAESAPVAVSPAVPAPAAVDSPASLQSATNPSAPVALAVQPEPGFSRMGLVGIGIAVTLLAGGFFFVMQRRARSAASASLITRSFDRDRK